MEVIKNKIYNEERSLFSSSELEIYNTRFIEGESPLKESSNIYLEEVTFSYKYPLWYSKNIKGNRLILEEMARSGIWYTSNIDIIDSVIHAPKTFRRSTNIKLTNVILHHADETLWKCKKIKLNNIKAKGDYFGFNSEDIEINNLYLDGNYAFDGGKNIVIRNSVLNSKDAIWNSENVLIENTLINGEYLGWNSKDVTLVNCKIISHQGLCYMENVRLVNVEIIDSDLILEYSSNIDADIVTVVDSIKNPTSGIIRVKGVKELILDPKYIDVSKVKVELK